MIVFRSRWGRTWAGRLDVDAAVRMFDLAELDVMVAGIDLPTRERLAGTSPEASADLAAAIYAIFQPEADRRRVSPRRFGKDLRVVRDGGLRAMFFEEIDAFFRIPGPEQKPDGKPGKPPTPAELWQSLYRMAGEIGVSPGPHTLGEIYVMAEGHRRAEWARNAALRADVINSNPFRGSSARPVNPAELDPTGGLAELAQPQGGCDVTPDNFLGVFGALMKGIGRG